MIVQSVFAEFEAICSKGVCENSAARLLRCMRGEYPPCGWIGKIEFIEALVKANTVGVQHGSHRAVCENGFGREAFHKFILFPSWFFDDR